MLAYINSPHFGLKCQTTSIESAVAMLGFEKTKEWLNIMYVSKLAEDKLEELVIISTSRAKFSSLLSENLVLIR